MITVMQDGQRQVIAGADATALSLGLSSGLVLSHARALVHGLDIRDADLAGDHALLERLASFAVRRWTPMSMVDQSGDGLLLDITGSSQVIGDELMFARALRIFCKRLGLETRIAVAGTIGAAHAIARYGRDQISLCPINGEPEALSPLPLRALRLDGGQLSEQALAQRVRCVVTHAVLYHAPDRRLLQDVVTAIREKRTIDALGFKREPFSDRSLTDPAEMARLFAAYPDALQATQDIAAACRFDFSQLRYQYPAEAPPGVTPQALLERLHVGSHQRSIHGGAARAAHGTRLGQRTRCDNRRCAGRRPVR